MLLPFLATLLIAFVPADDQVLAEARAALEALDQSHAEAQRLIERAELEGQDLSDLLEVVSGPLPEAPPEIETYPDEGRDALQARFETWRAHVTLLEQRAGAPERGRQREAVQAERFAELDAAVTALTEAAEEASGALAKVDPLVAEQKVTAEEAAKGLGLEELGQGATKIETGRALAAALPERITTSREAEDATLAALVEIEAPPIELLNEVIIQRDASEILMSVAAMETREREELVKQDEAGIQEALDTAMKDWGAMARVEELKVEALREWQEVEALDQARTARTSPKREDFAEGEGHDELRAARRELAWTEAMLTHREETVDLLASSRTTLVSLRQRLIDGAKATIEAGNVLARIRTAIQARALPADPTGQEPVVFPQVEGQDLWQLLRSVVFTEAKRTFLKEELDRRLALTDFEEAEQQALEAQVLLVKRARLALEEEEAYATMVAEMEQLGDGPLVAELDPAGSALAALTEARREDEATRRELVEIEAKLPGVLDRVIYLDTPYARQQISIYPARGEEIRQEIKALVDREEDLVPADTSELTVRWEAITDRLKDKSDEVDEDEQLLSPTKADLRELRLAQRDAKERLRYFLDLEVLVGELEAAIAEYQEIVDAAGVAFGARLSLERRLNAASREVRRRGQEKVLPAARLPEGLVTALTRAEITALVGERQIMRREIDDRQALLREELLRQELYLSFKEWAEVGGDVAQQNNNLIAQPASHVESARQTVDELKDFERGNLEYNAQQRALDEASVEVRVLATLARPERRERFEVTLIAYYLEVANLERVIGEYRSAQEAFRALIEVNQEYRTKLSGAVEAMERIEYERGIDYQMMRALVAIAANPSRRIRIASDFAQAQGRELPRVLDEHGYDHNYWADMLAMAEARLWGDRVWVADLTRRLSRHGIESEVDIFRRHIAHIGAEIEEVEGTREQLLSRIEELRSKYRNDLWDNALWTLLKILAIPILAMLTVRGLMRVASRMKSKTKGEVGSLDRQRRLETLTNVTTASIRAVVWVIAGIYILGFLGLDITPIIASASVVGLAVAFGAQSLVRDFFAGFFMLLEHQYSVGDIVDLGIANGRIEHISLRMTTLRDLQGTVHYVPNGLVQRVANKTKGWSQVVMEVPVPYGEDVDRVTAILREVLAELQADDEFGALILDEPSVAGVQAMVEGRVDLRLFVKTQPGEQWGMARELRRRIKCRFDAEGIAAPYPHRVIHSAVPG